MLWKRRDYESTKADCIPLVEHPAVSPRPERERGLPGVTEAEPRETPGKRAFLFDIRPVGQAKVVCPSGRKEGEERGPTRG